MPLMIHNGKLLVRNGALALSPDCCCDCFDARFTVVFSYDGGNISGTSGDHTISAQIETGATDCGTLAFSVTKPTFAEVAAAGAATDTCVGPCGTSGVGKTGSSVNGRFRVPYRTTPASNAASVGYECNRLFSWTRRPSVNFRVSQLVVSNLPAGRTLNVQYRRTGYDPGVAPWLAVTQDGTYADPTGSSVWEGGTAGTNTNLYVDFYFT